MDLPLPEMLSVVNFFLWNVFLLLSSRSFLSEQLSRSSRISSRILQDSSVYPNESKPSADHSRKYSVSPILAITHEMERLQIQKNSVERVLVVIYKSLLIAVYEKWSEVSILLEIPFVGQKLGFSLHSGISSRVLELPPFFMPVVPQKSSQVFHLIS